MEIKHFYDPRTNTLTYVVYDPASRDAVVIDPVLDYDPSSSHVWHESVDLVLTFLKREQLAVKMVIETHAHADHLSGSRAILDHYPDAVVAVGSRIVEVQRLFKTIFDLPADFPTDGRQFGRLLKDGETVQVGTLSFKAISTPGHTPACMSILFGDALFTGDALFMPDSGTGRCDFPGGSATDLYRSIQERIYSLPPETRVFVGHDYQPRGRALAWQTTIGEEREQNVHLKASTTLDDFIEFRTRRDASLAAPRLLFQSVQVNVDAGALPRPEANQIRYLRIPINVFRPEHANALELGDVPPTATTL